MRAAWCGVRRGGDKEGRGTRRGEGRRGEERKGRDRGLPVLSHSHWPEIMKQVPETQSPKLDHSESSEDRANLGGHMGVP